MYAGHENTFIIETLLYLIYVERSISNLFRSLNVLLAIQLELLHLIQSQTKCQFNFI